jgi:hypothetical protein
MVPRPCNSMRKSIVGSSARLMVSILDRGSNGMGGDASSKGGIGLIVTQRTGG